MAFQPSEQQAVFFNWLENGKGNAVVIAVAGSGKTTSIVEGIPYLDVAPRRTALFLAFNSTIASEVKGRTEAKCKALGMDPRLVEAKTFHGLGFGPLRRALENHGHRNIKPEPKKNQLLLKELLSEEDFEMYASFAAKLVGYAKGQGIGPLEPSTEDAWWALVKHHDLQLESDNASETRGIEIARQLMGAGVAAAKARGLIDFDDQLYLPLLWNLKIWQHQWVFIDEAQDTNPVRRALAKRALAFGGRLVAVGDPKQAIYGFTGATHDAIDLIRKEFNACELPLTVSYRCPKAVGELVRGLVPYFQVHANAPTGRIMHLNVIDMSAMPKGTAILCRNTAPLVGAAYWLIGQGRGARIIGREIGDGLVNLVRKMRAGNIERLQTKLNAYREREVAKLTAKGEEHKAEAVMDRCACIETVIENLDERTRTIGGLVSKLEGLFDDSAGNDLVLCTGHKAKGKEWKMVGVLRPDLMPSKYARQEWQAQQEVNLEYVVYTRAQDTLIFLEGDLSKEKAKARETKPAEAA